MLSQGIFQNGLKSLVIEFEVKGFKMPKERAAKWYDHMKHLTDGEFNQSIDYVLESFSYPPTMADILKSVIRERTIL